MSALFGALICLSPLLMVGLGYAWGRYGLPIEIRRRRLADRRTRPDSAAVEAPAVEIYRYDAPPPAASE